MAEMLPGFNIVGPISNISAYKRRGSDKIFVRVKGGAKKEKINRLPSFEKTRRINKEFGGRSTASKWTMKALYPQKALADYNISGPLNALLKPIQEMDTQSETGKRNICLSKHPKLLEGFSLNHRYPLDSIVRTTITHSISKETMTATVQLPSLLPGITFQSPYKHPLYSFIVTLGVVPDLFYEGNSYYTPLTDSHKLLASAESDWHPVIEASPAMSLEVSITDRVLLPTHTLLLSLGIRFGTVGVGGQIYQVKYAGCARILAVV